MPENRPPIGNAPAGAPCEGASLRTHLLRPLAVLRAVRRVDLSADVAAGLTVAAVAIPQAIAYASIAELPPHYGLYTAAVGAVVGALWGCSRHLSTGPVNAVSLLVLPVLLAVAEPGTPRFLLAASTVAIMVGLLNLILAALRFGALVTLASRSVLIGFAAGAAVHIAAGQGRHLLGLDVPAMPELYRTAGALVAGAPGLHGPSLAVGAGALALLLILRRAGRRLPAALAAVVLAAVAVRLLGLDEQGVRVVGSIPRSLPPPTWLAAGAWPDLQMVRGLVVGAMAVAALGLIEAVASAQTLARRSGDRIDSNQEFLGQGLANIACGLFSGYPCSGSFTRSALARQAGGRSHLAGVVTGLAVLVAMLLLAPWARWIPRPAIAGVLLVVAWDMLDRAGIRRVLRTSRGETAVMLVTFAATLVLPLDFAVLSGVVFSLAFFVVRSSLPRVVPVVPESTFRHFVHDPERPVCPQMAVINLRGPLFFGAVHHVEEELRRHRRERPGQIVLVLRMHAVDICDLSGVELLESTVRTYRELGGDVFLVRPRQPVLQVLDQSGFLDDCLGRDYVLEQEGAIEHLFDRVLDPVVCIYECEHRVFAECQALEKHVYEGGVPSLPRHVPYHDRHVAPEIFQELAADPGAVLLDIREPAEFRQGHLPGAALLPLRTLPERGSGLPRDRTLLLCCRSGRRTARALTMLEGMGFDRLHGLRGGVLAWRAEGLPFTRADAAGDAPRDAEALADGEAPAAGQRRALNLLRLRRRTEELAAELTRLSATEDRPGLRDTLEQRLEREEPADAVVHLDPARPVLIVSDSHALRLAFHKLLLDKYVDGATNLEAAVEGRLQILLLGDLMHSESRSRWQAVEDEYVTRLKSAGGGHGGGDGAGATPFTDREMANSFGLAAMIMTLRHALPGFHYLKGNHDNLLDADGGGNGRVRKLVAWPGEGEIARDWTLARLGSGFAGRYAAWEKRLPLFAVYDGRPGGLKFVASHSEPAGPYTLAQIADRGDDVVFGLTWSRNEGRWAPDVLRGVFGRDWLDARYFVSHTGSMAGVVHHPRRRLVILNKPRHLVAALVRPGVKEFEVHMVASP